MEQDLGNEDAEEDISLMEDSGTDKHAVFRTESIRGQPRSERAALETAVDSRKLRQRKMVRDYAEREKRKEKEASRQQKTAEKENVRYRETSQVTEESLEGFQDEIKGKAKRERILKEQKKQSRLSFGDEGDGMVHGAGTGGLETGKGPALGNDYRAPYSLFHSVSRLHHLPDLRLPARQAGDLSEMQRSCGCLQQDCGLLQTCP